MSYCDQYDEETWVKLSQVAVKGAEYNSPERLPHPKCLDGTRENLLGHTYGLADNGEKSRIIWLNGTAGIGKSAVAFTVADRMKGLAVTERRAHEKRLAGTFFFSRKYTKRCTTGYFFATLAYQLASNFPSIRDDVNGAIRGNPALLDPDKPLQDQMEALFLRPLQRLRFRLDGCPPVMFIIDAIDECISKVETAELIFLLGKALRELDLPVVHILLTSRSEPHILEAIQVEELRPVVCEIPMETFGKDVASLISLDGADVDGDIRVFLEDSFTKLRRRHSNFSQPTQHALEQLVSRAGKRFIIASTMMKFIDDEHNDPRDRLQLMLELTNELLPGTEVYKLYDNILSTCADPKRAYLLLSIVAALANPLPISQISELLGFGQGKDVEKTLVQLRSVMDIPTDSSLPVNLYHSSIRDYVSSPSNCGLFEEQWITSSPHSLLADSSFRLMIRNIPKSSGLLDALLRLKAHNRAMKSHAPHRLRYSLAFIVEPPTALPVLITLLLVRGSSDPLLYSNLSSWLGTPNGRAWLRTQRGNHWLGTRNGLQWLQSPPGLDWVESLGQRNLMQSPTSPSDQRSALVAWILVAWPVTWLVMWMLPILLLGNWLLGSQLLPTLLLEVLLLGIWVLGIWILGKWQLGIWQLGGRTLGSFVRGICVLGIWMFGAWLLEVWLMGIWLLGICLLGICLLGIWLLGDGALGNYRYLTVFLPEGRLYQVGALISAGALRNWLLGIWLLGICLLGIWLLGIWLLGVWLLATRLLGKWLLPNWLLPYWLLPNWLPQNWLLPTWLLDNWLLDNWLPESSEADWLQTSHGRGWLQTPPGQNWLQTLGGQEWLQCQGEAWLQTSGGLTWLQTSYGQAWQSTPVASLWMHMDEFLNTVETVNEFRSITESSSLLPAFQAIQQFKSLPDFLMFPAFLAFTSESQNPTSALAQVPDLEIIRTFEAFVSFTNEAWERSQSASEALMYACQHWAMHLSQAPNSRDDRIFKVFWDHHLLSWLEMQWCLKGLRSCLIALSEAQKNISTTPQSLL